MKTKYLVFYAGGFLHSQKKLRSTDFIFLRLDQLPMGERKLVGGVLKSMNPRGKKLELDKIDDMLRSTGFYSTYIVENSDFPFRNSRCVGYAYKKSQKSDDLFLILRNVCSLDGVNRSIGNLFSGVTLLQ